MARFVPMALSIAFALVPFSDTSFAVSPVRYGDGRYRPFQRCAAMPSSMTAQEAAELLTQARHAPEDQRYYWLMRAIRALSVNGFAAEANNAHQLLDESGLEYPMQRHANDPLSLLSQARTLAAYCMEDKALELVQTAERMVSATSPYGTPLSVRAEAALLRARLGFKEGLRDRLTDLRRLIDGAPPGVASDNRMREVRQLTAKAAAEADQFDLALELVPADDPGPLLSELAQIAVHRGDIRRALSLVSTNIQPRKNWTPDLYGQVGYARLAVLQALVDQGRLREAEELVTRWGWFVVSPAFGAQKPILARLVALKAATAELAGILDRLSPYDALACRNALATVAARAGKPEEALTLVDARAGEGIEDFPPSFPSEELEFWSRVEPAKAEAMAHQPELAKQVARMQVQESYIKAMAAIALAFESKGLEEQGLAILEQAGEAVRDRMSGALLGPPTSMANAYADLGYPDKGWAFLNTVAKGGAPHDGLKWGLWSRAVESLARRRRIGRAFQLVEELPDRRELLTDSILDRAGDRPIPVPPYADNDLLPCSVMDVPRD